MTTAATPFKARSWLFAPGDSEKKIGKAADGDADIVLLDLEDSVMPENKPAARELVRDFLASRDDRQRLWARVNPLSGGETAADLAAIMPSAPGAAGTASGAQFWERAASASVQRKTPPSEAPVTATRAWASAWSRIRSASGWAA